MTFSTPQKKTHIWEKIIKTHLPKLPKFTHTLVLAPYRHYDRYSLIGTPESLFIPFRQTQDQADHRQEVYIQHSNNRISHGS